MDDEDDAMEDEDDPMDDEDNAMEDEDDPMDDEEEDDDFEVICQEEFEYEGFDFCLDGYTKVELDGIDSFEGTDADEFVTFIDGAEDNVKGDLNVNLGGGNDIFISIPGVTTVNGGEGDDWIFGGQNIYGDEGDDWIFGQFNTPFDVRQVLDGGDGQNHVFGRRELQVADPGKWIDFGTSDS